MGITEKDDCKNYWFALYVLWSELINIFINTDTYMKKNNAKSVLKFSYLIIERRDLAKEF